MYREEADGRAEDVQRQIEGGSEPGHDEAERGQGQSEPVGQTPGLEVDDGKSDKHRE